MSTVQIVYKASSALPSNDVQFGLDVLGDYIMVQQTLVSGICAILLSGLFCKKHYSSNVEVLYMIRNVIKTPYAPVFTCKYFR